MRDLLACFAFVLIPLAASADTSVRGYYRDNGTYVAPHHRSSPDSSTLNNWSSKGNYNPYTGEKGTVDPYGSSSSYGTYGSSPKRGLNDLLGD